MKKVLLLVTVCFYASLSNAYNVHRYLNHDAGKSLQSFEILSPQSLSQRTVSHKKIPENALVIKREKTYLTDTQQYSTSYYQYYHGVRVLDGEITIHENSHVTQRGVPEKKVIGQLIKEIHFSAEELERLKTSERLDRALSETKAHFLEKHAGIQWAIDHESVQLIIKKQEGELSTLYEVSFYASADDEVPIFYHAFLDPNRQNKILKVWNDVKNISDKGPGGNEKTKKYHYGVAGIPALEVSARSSKCTLEDNVSNFIVVDMNGANPSSAGYTEYIRPFSYKCNSEVRDANQFYGAYSPADDAYFFGHLVKNMYQDWYKTKVLDLPKTVLRVHVTKKKHQPMENAFWDPVSTTINFGDGSAIGNPNVDRERITFYPLVSLDVVGHEMSHGFTAAHSNLQYYEEPGALNEAFSDMAAVASNAYLRETFPVLYTANYHTSDLVWTIGSSIIRNPDPNIAMRYIDKPSRDGASADCYLNASNCSINYIELVDFAKNNFDDEEEINGFIVHHGSGVFNHFFYILATSQGWDIKKAFNLMLKCNRDGYWNEYTDFQQAACYTLLAASDLAYDTGAVRNAFNLVGIETLGCLSPRGEALGVD